MEDGDASPLAKQAAVAVFGAVLRPASRCDLLVRGVAIPLSLGPVKDFKASIDRGLMFWPPRREARPEVDMAKF